MSGTSLNFDSSIALAFVDAYRWWLNCDHAFWQEAQRRDSINSHFVRAVGGPYRVNRTIKIEMIDHPTKVVFRGDNQGKPKQIRDPVDPHARALAAMLTGLPSNENLKGRAQTLADELVKLATDGHGKPISAATKVDWFVRPDGWTMFDRYASTAVLGRHVSSIDWMMKYYTALDERGFASQRDQVRDALSEPFPSLLAERVIDKFLFLKGIRFANNYDPDSDDEFDSEWASTMQLMGFVEALPDALRTQVVAQANKLADTISLDSLLSPKVAK